MTQALANDLQTVIEDGLRRNIAVGVLRFEKSLPWDISKTSLDSFDWPLGRPKRLESGTVADMAETDHLVLMPEKWFWFKRFSGVKARTSLAIPEPKAFQRNDYLLAAVSGGRFYRIMTADPALEKRKSNARVFTFGTTWVPDWKDLQVKKDRNISLIASAKRYMKGHKLRHKCADWIKENGIDGWCQNALIFCSGTLLCLHQIHAVLGLRHGNGLLLKWGGRSPMHHDPIGSCRSIPDA